MKIKIIEVRAYGEWTSTFAPGTVHEVLRKDKNKRGVWCLSGKEECLILKGEYSIVE